MKNRTVSFCVRLVLLMFATLSAVAEAKQNTQLLIAFHGPVHEQVVASRSLSAQGRTRARHRFGRAQVELWELEPGVSLEATLTELRKDKRVRFAEPNWPRYPYARVDDPEYPRQWALDASQTHFDAGVVGSGLLEIAAESRPGIEDAWTLTTGSRDVVVAVIDDSFELDHPDLSGNLWHNPGEIPGNGIDDDHNGFVDDVHGWDFVEQDADTRASARSDEGHGTAVAGVLGAVGNNGIGISGVAREVSLMPLKVDYSVAGELAAFEYAIANGAHIVNASWGGPQFSYAESGGVAKLEEAGILLVSAVGNYDMNNDWVADYPSSLPNGNILAVASSSLQGELSDWSHFGQLSVDIAAPGELLLTTMAAATSEYVSLEGLRNLDYGLVTGTSFSSAFAAGAAALLKAYYPAADYRELRARLIGAARTMNNSYARSVSDGVLDVPAALALNPGPLLRVSAMSLDDENANGYPDPGERLRLRLTLRNQWQSSAGGSVELRSGSPWVSMDSVAQRYPALQSGESTDIAFNLQLGDFSGFRRLELVLVIHPDEGGEQRQQLVLESGLLAADTTFHFRLMRDAYDEFHHYYFEVPPNTVQLVLSTTAAADIDLLYNPNEIPQFDYTCYETEDGSSIPYCRSQDTRVSASSDGDEQIVIDNPAAGIHHLVVLSFDQLPDSAYSVRASLTPGSSPTQPSQSVSSCGGGGGAWWLLMPLACFQLFRQLKRR